MEQETPQEQTLKETADHILLDGTWERKGRSAGSAAILGLLGIGAIYFNAQSLLAAIAASLAFALNPPGEMPAGFLERTVYLIELQATPFQIVLLLSEYLFMLLPALWIVRRWHTRQVRQYIRLTRAGIVDILLAVGVTLFFLPSANFIANEFTRQLDVPDVFSRIGSALFTAHSFPEFIWLVIVIAVTPALCEELFFRGYVQRTLERTMSWKSVLAVGVIFGLFHMQPLGLVTLSILGLLFGYFYFRSRSLLPGMAAHFSNNFLAILLLFTEPTLDDVSLKTSEQFPLLWIAATLPVAILLLVLYHHHTEPRAA